MSKKEGQPYPVAPHKIGIDSNFSFSTPVAGPAANQSPIFLRISFGMALRLTITDMVL